MQKCYGEYSTYDWRVHKLRLMFLFFFFNVKLTLNFWSQFLAFLKTFEYRFIMSILKTTLFLKGWERILTRRLNCNFLMLAVCTLRKMVTTEQYDIIDLLPCEVSRVFAKIYKFASGQNLIILDRDWIFCLGKMLAKKTSWGRNHKLSNRLGMESHQLYAVSGNLYSMLSFHGKQWQIWNQYT